MKYKADYQGQIHRRSKKGRTSMDESCTKQKEEYAL